MTPPRPARPPSPLAALLATQRTAVAEAWANRAGFWAQVAVMVVNDMVWVAFWVLFFDRVGVVRGWDVGRVLLLFAVLTTSVGLVLGVLANARRLGDVVVGGELDALLTLPVPTLPHLLVRRVEPVNVGDVVFGVGLFLVAGDPSPIRGAVYAVGVLAGAVLFTGFLVAVGSLAFFAGRGEAGELGLHAMIVLATYPADVFAGVTRGLLYTALPAAFVATVPANLVDDPDLVDGLVLVGMAALFAAAGVAAFSAGVRRYTSGAVWTRP